jgi:RimJ/RimL family protein N-acetyltransferase
MRYELRKAGRGLFIRSLTTSELPKYLEHLIRLDSTDRRMRFGLAIGDTGIREHVQRIDLRTDYILALFDDNLDVVAAAHIVRAPDDDVAEFAFSVDREWRSCGVGCELFNRTVLWARNRGIRQAILYCLCENQAIRQLARQAGVQMTVDAGEIEGRLDLLPATPLSFLAEHTSECLAWLGQLDQSLCRFWTVAGAGTPYSYE